METAKNLMRMLVTVAFLLYLTPLKEFNVALAAPDIYYITPGPMSLCPNKTDLCVSLNQFASEHQNISTNTTLFFLPGKHNLELELAVNYTASLVITAKFHNTRLYCDEQIHVFFRHVDYVSIGNLMIFSCVTTAIHTKYFVLKDSQIQDVYEAGQPALTLVNVNYSEIKNVSFNSISNNIDGVPQMPIGGAVTVANSTILITKTVFVNNSAERGSAIFCYKSNVTLTECNITNNWALKFGAIEAHSGVIQIYNGVFNGNTANNVSSLSAFFCTVYIENSILSDSNAFSDDGCAVNSAFSRLVFNKFTVSNNTAGYSVFCIQFCEIKFSNSTVNNNIATYGAVLVYGGIGLFENSVFNNNSVLDILGAFDSALHLAYATVNITHCSIHYNKGGYGGALNINGGIVQVENSSFYGNQASQKSQYNGVGAITVRFATFMITDSLIADNMATLVGAMFVTSSRILMKRNVFINNVAMSSNHYRPDYNYPLGRGGGVFVINSDITIEDCSFFNNKAGYGGAVSIEYYAFFKGVHFQNYTADHHGHWKVTMVNVTFIENVANVSGGAICIQNWNNEILMVNTSFQNNRALEGSGGAIYLFKANLSFIGLFNVQNNTGYLGAVYVAQSTVTVNGMLIFSSNRGSFFAFSSNVILSGEHYFLDNSNNHSYNQLSSFQEGGALTLFQSYFSIFGQSSFFTNQAMTGGAILVTQSTIDILGNTTIAFNKAWLSGGGVYAYQSQLNFRGYNSLIGNTANQNGGGMYAISAAVKLLNGSLFFVENTAEKKGGGIFLELNSKLFVVKDERECIIHNLCGRTLGFYLDLEFINNTADYGGAVYVDDYTMSGSCGTISQSLTMECFCQVISSFSQNVMTSSLVLGLNDISVHIGTISIHEYDYNFVNIHFSNNNARIRGASLYGGLLDRCSISPFAEVIRAYSENIPTINYFLNVTDIDLNDVTSDAVGVCFCINNQPDCEYQPPTLYIQRGHALTVSVVAVDQVSISIPGTIHALLNGGLSDNQLIQSTTENCTELKYNILSTKTSEQLKLYPEGPCKDIGKSQRTLNVEFLPCTCPIGFQLTDSENNCKCECDTRLYPCISNCSIETESVLRESNCWFSFVNNQTGFVIHPHCPFDYCFPHSQSVEVNLNIPNGADAQCAFNRSGKLCGSCEDGLSLSLGTSHCLSCSNKLLLLLIPFSLVGILLVVFLLVCRLNVSTGTLNGLIFYANIVTANHALLLPFERPNFITVFIAWLNLDFGFKTCFYNRMDAYMSTWLQFAFPSYIIFLVVMIIVTSEHSNRFARLLHRTRPIAALSTLIFLSYTKFLRTIVAVLSFTTLEYPDGSHEIVWLLDANVAYLKGKHIPLFIAAVLVFLVGVMFTSFLFFWQWILALNDRLHLAKWINSGKLFAVMESFQNPLKLKHRYWTGLLMLGRVVLYTVSSLNVFGDPSVNLYSVIIVTLSILLLKLFAYGAYKKWSVDFLESIFIILLCTYTASTLFVRETTGNQEILAYFTNVIVLIMTLIILISHVYLEAHNLKAFFQSQRARREPISDLPLVDFTADQFQQEMEPSITEVELPVAMDTDESPMDNDSGEEVSDEGAPLLKTY